MGAPVSGMQAADQPNAESLLSALKTIDAAERRKHATVLNYWLSIRGDRELPQLHDLDPLEISDAAPCSLLLELIGGGDDAEVRHLGETLRTDDPVERIVDAPRPSLLASIAGKLSLVAISRNFLAFEDEFATAGGTTRCWITLLPLSSAGAWVDYVYGFVSLETVADDAGEAAEPDTVAEPPQAAEPDTQEAEPPEAPDPDTQEGEPPEATVDELEAASEEGPVSEGEVVTDSDQPSPAATPAAEDRPGFSKFFDALAGVGGFYGAPAKFEAAAEPADEEAAASPEAVEEEAAHSLVEKPTAPAAEEPAEAAADEETVAAVADEAPAEPAADEETSAAAADELPAALSSEGAAELTRESEGPLQTKLAEVRAKADEARMAKLRSNAALYEGLSAAYDFALDAEGSPEEYLRLVEAQGLKIQLRSPMTPVVKLAFDGLCDESMIAQLEAVLAWALEQDLPRGSLAERIQSEGGITQILNGEARAA